MRQNSPHIDENIDPELQWAIDNQYRTNPELRDEILDYLGDEDLDAYVVNVEHGDVKLKLSPEKMLEKLTGLSDLGNVITTMRGGNGVAVITDKDLVVKITGDKAEYITAKELEGINSKYIVKVHESKVIDPDDQSIYTDDSKPAYLIIMDKVDSPTPQQEKDWFDCCCSEDKPIYVDFTDPNGDAVVHPPVDDYDKCNKIYDDIMNIRKEVEKTGRRWVDIGIDNVGMKDGSYVLIDLGTNDPLPLNESKKIINEGFFDILSNLFKRPEQKSDTPDELNQYLQQLQDTLDENEIYDEEVSKLVDQLKDSDYIDLVDFPTMLRGLENKLLKSGEKNEIVIDYLTRLNNSLPKRAKYEKKLLQGQVPQDSEYYDEVEQEKSRIPKKIFKTEKELLQIELLKLQEWVKKNNVPVAVVFEGRDTAGKGSTIKKLTEYLDPKYFNIVALGIPSEDEKKNWFQRYEKYIEPGKITFFDRSWYNRGIVEPVMGYSSKEEYEQFMKEVVPFEKSLLSRGVVLIKFWLSITQGKQEQRFTIRQQSPLKYWKYSPNDEASREKWDEYTDYKERVLKDTSHSDAPWVVLDSNDKRMSALNAMRHVLDQVDYDGKDTETVRPKYPEAISTIRRRLDEQSEGEVKFTKSAERVLNTAWSMSKDSNHKFTEFRSVLVKFFNIPLTTAEELTFLCKYNIARGNEKVEEWVIPYIYESTVFVYGDYETEDYYDDCDDEGYGESYGTECECLSGEIMDEDDEEYRPCDESELTNIHYEDCECEEWDELRVELYYYPIYRKYVYSTSDPHELGCVYDSHHDLDDYVNCLEVDDELVQVMSEEHEDDTDRVIEDEFEWDKDQTIADTWEYEIDTDEWSGSYMINKINEIYPDKSTPQQLNESNVDINTNTPTIIFVGGLDTRSGDKSLSQQEADLRKGLGGNFKIISHRYTDGSGAIKSLQQNPNAFVVLFSAGAKHAEDLVSNMSNPSKMYIVEPYTCSSTRKKGVDNAITKGVPRKNVLGGPSDCTGKNVAGTFRNSYGGESHWDAVRGVGQIIKNSTRLNEQQMSLFPTGEWRLPVGEEDEIEVLEKMIPESIVKIIFQRWDKEEPLRMDDRDFKLFGIPNDDRLLISLMVRYLQNTTRPIPVGRVWDCEDLVRLFEKNDREQVEKYLCEEDFNYEDIYGYDEWYDGLLDNLDDMSWNYITTLLGVDKSTAEKLLGGNYTTEEEGEIWREKEDDIDKIKDLMRWSNERAAADVTFNAIRENIKDEIEEHFENEGKFDYDSKGGIVYEIKGDLKDYVQDPDTWDNIERFNNHEDYRDRHLQDIFYDFEFKYKGRDGFQQSIPDVIFNLFMENDFAIWWDSEKEELNIDSRFFDNYWYPDYDFNQDFREYMMEEYYEQLRGNINEHVSDRPIILNENPVALVGKLLSPLLKSLYVRGSGIQSTIAGLEGNILKLAKSAELPVNLGKGIRGGGIFPTEALTLASQGNPTYKSLLTTLPATLKDGTKFAKPLNKHLDDIFLHVNAKNKDFIDKRFIRSMDDYSERLNNAYNTPSTWTYGPLPSLGGGKIKGIPITMRNEHQARGGGAFLNLLDDVHSKVHNSIHFISKTNPTITKSHPVMKAGNDFKRKIDKIRNIDDEVGVRRFYKEVSEGSSTFSKELGKYLKEIDKNVSTIIPNIKFLGEQKNYDAEIELTNSDAYIEETPITKQEANILNLVLDRFSIEELDELVSTDLTEIGSELENKWINFVKLIGETANTPETFTKSTRWAKWLLDNLDKAEYENEEGNLDFDFNNVDILTKNYPSVYEVEGDERIWQQEYRKATVDIPAFDSEDAHNRGQSSFWDYDPDFETYDYGDIDSDYFDIGDIQHYNVLKEQIIDTENLPEEEISPDLVEGDKVFVWDITPDPAPPGGTSKPIPSTVIGVVTEVLPDDVIDRDDYRGGIKYIVDTTSGLIGLYRGGTEGNIGEDAKVYKKLTRDKWVKLNNKNLQEIKKITNLQHIERQKDFTLKKSFMESINNLTEKDITPIKESVVESRVTLFNYLDGITKTNLIKEEELPNLLIGGRTWTDRFTVSSSIDLDDIKENSNKVRDIIFNNTKLKLDNPSFIETKRDLLETAKQTVTLWKETSNTILK